MYIAFIELDVSQIFGVLTTLFYIWMMIHCLGNNRVRHKTFWFLFILFTHMIGAMVYFFTRGPWLKIKTWRGLSQQAPTYQAPAAPKPVRETYPTYEQGYQQQAPTPAFREEEQPLYAPSSLQPQYEQPQVKYPEPPQMQQH